MKFECYVCVAIILAGLLIWAVSSLLEQKSYFITGNHVSIRAGGKSWLPPSSESVIQLDRTNITNGEMISEKIVNKSIATLTTNYGSSLNISRIVRAIVEDPSGVRIGVGFFICTQEGQKLVVVLPDGWIQEYLPSKE